MSDVMLSERIRKRKREYWADSDDMFRSGFERARLSQIADGLEEAAVIVEQHELQLETTNAALTKRVAELEETLAHERLLNAVDAQRLTELRINALPSNCTNCNGHGAEPPGCPESGPCETCGGWTTHKRLVAGETTELRKCIADLQSQLAWTPVSAGLPTEPEDTVLVRQRRTGGCIYGLLWNNGTTLHAVTEEQPCGLYEYGSPVEAMRDWDEFRRIELPKGGES